jgi:hypothetical protein
LENRSMEQILCERGQEGVGTSERVQEMERGIGK